MKVRSIKILVLLTLPLLIVLNVYAVGSNVKYIDSGQLLKEAKQSKVEAEKIEQEFSPKMREIKAKIELYEEQKQDLKKNSLVLQEKERDEKTKQLQKLEKEITRDKQKYQADYTLRRKQSLIKLQKIMFKAVVKIAKKKGYDLIVQQAVYASPDANITTEILTELNKM